MIMLTMVLVMIIMATVHPLPQKMQKHNKKKQAKTTSQTTPRQTITRTEKGKEGRKKERKRKKQKEEGRAMCLLLCIAIAPSAENDRCALLHLVLAALDLQDLQLKDQNGALKGGVEWKTGSIISARASQKNEPGVMNWPRCESPYASSLGTT